MKLRYSRPASRDIERLRVFIAPRHPEAVRRSVLRLLKACDTLIEFPFSGRTAHTHQQDIREMIVSFGKEGYTVRYRISAKYITILRIWHQKEKRR